MRVLVCGGRYFNNKTMAFDALNAIHRETPISVIIHGNARGGDTMGKLWAEANRIAQDVHKPNWDISHLTQRAPKGYTGIMDKYGNCLRGDWESLITEETVPKINDYENWYNVKAGFNRNGLMLKNGKPDLVVALPGGTGTADMIKISEDANVLVKRVQ